MTDVRFICSGNTCRSPMAKVLFEAACRERGLPYQADSAGVNAQEGTAASDGAFFAMKERGLDLSRHVAQPLTAMLAREARLLITMGESYVAMVQQRCPTAVVLTFDPPIRDPYGSSLVHYRATAAELASRMPWVLTQLQAMEGKAEG